MGVDVERGTAPCVVGTCRLGHGCHSRTNIRGIHPWSASAYPEYHIQYQPSNIPARPLPFLAHVNNSRQYFNCAFPPPVIRGVSRLFYHSSSPLPPPLCFSSLSWVTSGNMVDRVDTTPPVLYIPGWLGRSVAQGGGPWTIVAGHGLCDPRERFYLFIKYLDLRNWLASMGWEVLRGYFGERGIREGWGETISKVKGKDDFDGWSKLNAGKLSSPFFYLSFIILWWDLRKL